MATSVKFSRLAPVRYPGAPAMFSALRYWLFWLLLIAVLGLGINAYFDFRNRELDKRIEQINQRYRSINS